MILTDKEIAEKIPPWDDWKYSIGVQEATKFARAIEAAVVAKITKQRDDLLAALEELADLMDDVRSGDYKPDSFTTQPARAAIASVKGCAA